MVASLHALTDPKAAAAYYEADDYYLADAKAPSAWAGTGAEALGLTGEVDPASFSAMLAGNLPGGTTLGTTRHGQHEHKLGWDLTMSAPKSLSVMALVAGDQRLIEAHNEAVACALGFAERHAAVTRVRREEATERVATGKLVAATFPHFTARPAAGEEAAPQLHTHCVILNATQRADGAWRSLESQPLYKLQKAIGAVYHAELAARARELGYDVTIAPDSTFELSAVPAEVTRAFSARSAQIEAALEARGQTRATASAAQKAIAALDTRERKQPGSANLVTDWRARAGDLGFDESARRGLVANAEARVMASEAPDPVQRRLAATRAVTFAMAKISEREAVFTAAALEHEAGNATHGTATHADILAAITRAIRGGALISSTTPRAATGIAAFATREAVETEQRMLAREAAGRQHFSPLHDRLDAARTIAAAEIKASHKGHAWTDGQRAATRGLLLSSAAVTGIQGHAGTAKTTTVLATYAEAARAQGLTVRAFAPTASAAAELGRAIDADPLTVAGLLAKPPTVLHKAPEAWIVDEASMLSARDAEALLASAGAAQARLVLVGDVAQLGSVESGRAFGQLQEAGMPTHVLDQIVRQSNQHTREAVEAMLAGDAARAFAALDAGGGSVIEHHEDDVRITRIAQDFARLSPPERDTTLVLDPTREGRRQLTDAIRAALVEDGTLGMASITMPVLEPLGLTRAEAARAASYHPGQIVRFRKGNPEQRLRQGIGYQVEHIDAEAGTVRLLPPSGKPVLWQPARWGGDQAEAYTTAEQEFRAGDRVQFTRNNYAARRLNGALATVIGIDPARGTLAITSPDGTASTLDPTKIADRHIRAGWVQTIHTAQGATATRVIAHLESFRANTVDARAAYVAISRAREGASIYTDNRTALTQALGLRDTAQIAASDGALGRGAIVMPAVREVGLEGV